MTSKAEFEDAEWTVVLEGPPSAGMLVITAAKGGSFRETWAMSKAYAEARSAHGSSELLDEIVSSKPKMDHNRYHTPEELRTQCLQHLSDAVRIVATKGQDYERMKSYHFPTSATLPEGRSLAATSFRTREPCIANDFLADERSTHWHAFAREAGTADGSLFEGCGSWMDRAGSEGAKNAMAASAISSTAWARRSRMSWICNPFLIGPSGN